MWHWINSSLGFQGSGGDVSLCFLTKHPIPSPASAAQIHKNSICKETVFTTNQVRRLDHKSCLTSCALPSRDMISSPCPLEQSPLFGRHLISFHRPSYHPSTPSPFPTCRSSRHDVILQPQTKSGSPPFDQSPTHPSRSQADCFSV